MRRWKGKEMSKIKLTFAEINGIIPVMNAIVQVKMPYDISYQLYLITKNVDEANEYFVKKYKEILDSDSDTKDEDVNTLASTVVELTSEKFEDAKLIYALEAGDAKLSAVDIRLLSKLMEKGSEETASEPGFTIV